MKYSVVVVVGGDGLIRTVEVQMKQGTFKRPVAKLCLLEEAERSV